MTTGLAPASDAPSGKRTRPAPACSVAAAYLAHLSERGVDILFGNAGTDFAPLIEAYAQARQTGASVPRAVLAAHENLAVTMAHGFAMVCGRLPAVMVHVSVGTANMVCATMNAARENVAILLTAGRSPIHEAEVPGSRDGYIHWAQEMYDQAGLIREFVKWDYELRSAAQLETVLDRAIAIATTEPKGPVYLSLPRETLAAAAADPGRRVPAHAAAPAAPDPDAIRIAADLVAKAERPLVITANAGRDPAAFAALASFAEAFAVGVVQHRPRHLSLPSSHPMNLGYDPASAVGEADLILVLESDVPWIPNQVRPDPACPVVQCGLDPLYAHIPIRGFACDLAITGTGASILEALGSALAIRACPGRTGRRREWIARKRGALEARRATAGESAGIVIDPAWISRCLDEAKPADAIVISEYSLQLDHCRFDAPGCFFGSSSASGLGWGAGAALGAKLAAPGRDVIAVLGDGAYLFSNPVAVHHASAMHGLAVLFIINNDATWSAVRRSALAMYPDGFAAESNDLPFTQLHALPAFETICEAAGGYAERVEDPAALPAALARAMAVVRDEKRQALLNVICAIP